MIDIEFHYNQQIIIIQSILDEPFKNVIDKYFQKSQFDRNNVFFIVNGQPINPEEKIEKKMNKMNKDNKSLKILVQLMENTKVTQEYEKSKDIICPECFEPCQIKTENFKISLFGREKNHMTNLKIKNF